MTHGNRAHRWFSWILQWSVVLAGGAMLLVGCEDGTSNDETSASPNLGGTADTMTIDRVLRTDDRFSTLVAVLDSTGLDSTLAESGPYTLFAPPNAAFDDLPEGTIEVLMTERRGRMRTILAHHIVDGRVAAAALDATSALRTLSGDSLRVRRDSTLRIGTATVVEHDITTANGVIHVLDRVLPPPPEEE
jgi:uncharacterized surface protein with fasciclin (FAS1) repeats